MDKNQAKQTDKNQANQKLAPSPAAVRLEARQVARAAVEAAAAKVEQITAADLRPYQQQIMQAELMKRASETATARAGEAAQAANAGKLTLFVKYGLSTTDTFDVKTGVITRAGGAPAAPSPPAAASPARS